jgi:TM2 domain-containing membrane protein YozV
MLLPWLAMFTIGRVFSGILCLILQFTIIGWLPAAIWAMIMVSNYKADKRMDRLVTAIQERRT